MGYGYGLIAAVILAGIAVLVILLYVLRHYVFGRLLQKERTVRATVCGKRCDTPGSPASESTDTNALYNSSVNDGEFGCLGMMLSLVSAMPWKQIAKSGMAEPYIVRFDLGGKRQVNLAVSYGVYISLNQGQEGVLTYKGNRMKRFKSLATDRGGPVDVVETNED